MDSVQAITAAETIRLACAESLQANISSFKRPASNYNQQHRTGGSYEVPKKGKFQKHGNAGEHKQYGNAGTQNEQRNASKGKRKQEYPQDRVKQSRKKRSSTEQQGMSRDDPRYLCRLHRKFGAQANYCKEPEHCKYTKKNVNHVSASEQHSDESSERGKKPKKHHKKSHGA